VNLKRIAGPRIPRHEQEKIIVRGAVSFFVEQGFEGRTGELARRLGITQSLPYGYFPDKATDRPGGLAEPPAPAMTSMDR
jgi:AcrR family transcriptional regulator